MRCRDVSTGATGVTMHLFFSDNWTRAEGAFESRSQNLAILRNIVLCLSSHSTPGSDWTRASPSNGLSQ